MARRKQRRRREKERRHEYEYVYVDSEGREVEVEEDAARRSANGKAQPKQAPRGAQPRTVQPPSWRRTLRRAALFAPLMLIVLYLLRPKNGAVGSVVVNAAILLAFFVPFSYFMDSMMYRVAQKRLTRDRGSSVRGSSGR